MNKYEDEQGIPCVKEMHSLVEEMDVHMNTCGTLFLNTTSNSFIYV